MCSGNNSKWQQLSQDSAAEVRRDGIRGRDRHRKKLTARERGHTQTDILAAVVSGGEPAQDIKMVTVV